MVQVRCPDPLRTAKAARANRFHLAVCLALAMRCAMCSIAHDGSPACPGHHGGADESETITAEPAALGAPVADLPSSDATPLKFQDFYVTPLGPRGLEFTPQVKALDGQRVRIVGYMVRSRFHVPGTLLLTPRVLSVDDCHYGLADDLPPQTLHVTVPSLAGHKVPFVPGPLLLTGRLELGPKEQPDGRNFAVRLVLESVASAAEGAGSPRAGESPAEAGSHSVDHPVARDSAANPPGAGRAGHYPNPSVTPANP